MLALEPGLIVNLGHRLNITLDGKILIRNSLKTHFNLTAIDRGSHQLVATIHDIKGKTLISSKPVTIHLHRPSIIKRQKTPTT